ncbi:MAG: hypothetical protein JWN10_2810, partial [Solirubrobacterales bacterium]|nr:hypothetical protein [Solirubrobacterales bacterium]
TGDVYAVDQSNQRIEQFSAWGVFIRMFGHEVNASTHGSVCSAGESCQAGIPGAAGGQFEFPQGVAVDNGTSSSSRGDVYVVDFINGRVEKFGPAGEFLLAFGKEVDATTHANVCTAASGHTCQAGKSGTGEDEFQWPVDSFIDVGSTGTVYVGDENRIQEFAPTGEHTGQIALAGVGQITALAIDASGDLYVASSGLAGVHKYNPAGVQLAEFDSGSKAVEAIALNPAGDLFVGEHPPAARYRILEYSPSGAQLPSVGSEALYQESESTGLTANASGTLYVSEDFPETAPTPYRILAFGKPPPGEPPQVPPSIDSESVSSLGVTDAAVRAQISPHFLETTYYVQYGTDTSYSLGDVPAPPGTVLGGGEVQADQPASVTLSALTPGTLYHYRVVAQGKGGTAFGADQTFTTFASGEVSGLPDGRIYEQVSSLKKAGNEAGIENFASGEVGFAYGADSADGEHVVYKQVGPSGETHSGTDFYSVSSRDATGWNVSAVLPPGCGVNASNFLNQIPHSVGPSANFSRFVFAAGGPFGAGDCEEGTWAVYRTASGASEPEVWLSGPTITNPKRPGATARMVVIGGSPSLSTVYFAYPGTLVPEDASRAPHVGEFESTSAFGLYEWNDGKLGSAGILPNEPGEPGYKPEKSPAEGEPDSYGVVPAATAGETTDPAPEPSQLDNEVSQDGSKIFFVSPEPVRAGEAGTPTELYVREHGEGTAAATVLVSRDELKGAEPAPGAGAETAVTPVNGPRSPYVFATPDGSRAFFASTDQLTSTAPADTAVKEYEFNVNSTELLYLPAFGEPASAPFSRILTSSQDGSSFIFDNPSTKQVELWERPPGGPETVTKIADYSTPSSPTFTARAIKQAGRTAYVLQTNAVLSGGFNNSAAAQQIYRYVPGGRLACVSCAPVGTGQSSTQPFGWARVVADEGARIFFGTAEKLLAHAINGVDDVYEWEQVGTGSCRTEEREGGCLYLISSGASPDPSFLTDNSESGDVVFFATREGLVKGDTDESYDVYDARVNGGFPEPAPPAECLGSCRTLTAPPALAAPLTTVLGPSGNLTAPLEASPSPAKPKPKPLTRAQKLAKALKACQKKPKRKRAVCERQASRKYGAKPKAKRTQRSPRRRA